LSPTRPVTLVAIVPNVVHVSSDKKSSSLEQQGDQMSFAQLAQNVAQPIFAKTNTKTGQSSLKFLS
jgi:hypothetical protein